MQRRDCGVDGKAQKNQPTGAAYRQALESKREEFLLFDRSWRADVRDYARRLRALDGRSARDVIDAVSTCKEPGAIPSDELDRAGSMALPFGKTWRTHEEARRWAID
ncbi:MAG: hypothetical protein ACXW4O_16170, partial [Candidatus Binatia bacterium]